MLSRDCRSAERLGVLVVEPRELVAARLKAQLERLGHLVLGRARDGEEAIAAAQRLHPSLVLMETALPGLDGVSTARAIVTERPVPVILLAGYVGAELVRRAREAGVVAYPPPPGPGGRPPAPPRPLGRPGGGPPPPRGGGGPSGVLGAPGAGAGGKKKLA